MRERFHDTYCADKVQWPMVKRIYIGASDAQRGMRPGQSQMTFFDTGYGQQTQNVPHQRAQEQGPHAQTRWRGGAAAATVETQAPLPPRHLGWHLRFPSEGEGGGSPWGP